MQPFRRNVETPPYRHTFLHVPCKPPVESRNALLYIYVPTRSVRSPRIPPLNHENAPMRPYSPYAPSTRRTKNLQPHNHTSGFVDGPSSPSPSLWIYSYAEKEMHTHHVSIHAIWAICPQMAISDTFRHVPDTFLHVPRPWFTFRILPPPLPLPLLVTHWIIETTSSIYTFLHVPCYPSI